MSENLSAVPSAQQPKVVMLLLEELFTPTWNPRKFVDPIEQANLVTFIKNGGKTRRIEVLQADKGWWIISGQRRVLAFRELKKTYIEAEIMEITLAEAKIQAETSNEGVKPYWLDSYENWVILKDENRWNIRELADELGKDKSVVNRAMRIMSLLNPSSRATIREDLEAQKALFFDRLVSSGDKNVENKGKLWKLTDGTVRQLIPLLTGRPVEEAQSLAQEALKTILKDQLNAPQVKKLVTPHLILPAQPEASLSVKTSGDGSAQGTKAPASKATHTHQTGVPAEAEASGHTAATHTTTAPKADEGKPESEGMGAAETFFWEWMAGISFISQIKSKLKKGEPLSGGEKVLVGSWRLAKGFGWLAKHFFKGLHTIIKTGWKLLKDADKFMEDFLGKQRMQIVHLILIAVLALFIWNHYQRIVFHPLRTITEWIMPKKTEAAVSIQPTPVIVTQTAAPVANAKPLVKRKPVSQPIVAAQREDINSINSELAGLPNNIFLKPFAYTPGAMNDDMSGSRMADLQDGEKYTVLLGGDKQTVAATNPSFSKWALTLQSSLGGLGLLGSTTRLEIYWESVKEFHVSEIDVTSAAGTSKNKMIYQLSILSSDLKKPLTIQCLSAENMERLITALEFRLKASRGTVVPIVAMPYLYQGLRLNNDGQVTTLWADSPMDKAGLKLGEYVWSLQTNTPNQQRKADLEAQLQSLAPGQYPIYEVTASSWKRGVTDMKTYQLDTFNPLRHKAILITP